MNKTKTWVVAAAALGILSPSLSLAAGLEAAGDAAFAGALGAVRTQVAFAQQAQKERRAKSPEELKNEADRADQATPWFVAGLPQTAKESCEAFGDRLYVVSPKTGNAYCIEKYKDDDPNNGENTRFELRRLIETRDYWASLPKPPAKTAESDCATRGYDYVWTLSSKGNGYCLERWNDMERKEDEKTRRQLLREADLRDEWASRPVPAETAKDTCEKWGNSLFVTSPKTGNSYCIPKYRDEDRQEEMRTGDIRRRIETEDYWAAQAAESCAKYGYAWVVSSKGNGRCLNAYFED
ncbi:MAG: hypothetical protein HY553_20260 [Elusimicrobia bacterium]|nr:hypothetical protein [Elusimicrobiota bacterium]